MTVPIRPWYREPMLWLALGIPLATVAGGIETMRLASQDGVSDVEPEPVKRTAQAQQADLAPELVAAERNLVATLTIDADGQLYASIPGVATNEGPLLLDLVHPIRQRDDRQLSLAWRNDRWQAATPWPAGTWKLRLVDRQSHWRLTGRTSANAGLDGQRLELQSALSPR